MEHVIAMAPEDAREAECLAAAIGASGLAGRLRCIPVEDERSFEAVLDDDRDGQSTYVLLVSRALSERVASCAVLDELLGSILFGHRRVLPACLPSERAPSPELLRIARRHDAITDEANLEGVARRVIGRLGRAQVHASANAVARGSPGTRRLRAWLVATIVVLIAVLAVASLTNLHHS